MENKENEKDCINKKISKGEKGMVNRIKLVKRKHFRIP